MQTRIALQKSTEQAQGGWRYIESVWSELEHESSDEDESVPGEIVRMLAVFFPMWMN